MTDLPGIVALRAGPRVSVTVPAAGYWPLLLLPLVDPVVHGLRRRRTQPAGR